MTDTQQREAARQSNDKVVMSAYGMPIKETDEWS